MEKLEKRYPDLAFLIRFFPHEKVQLQTDPEELAVWLDQQKLKQIEVLYLVGLTALPTKVLDWLAEKQERALIFIEHELGGFAQFSEEELFEHPQVHFHYAQEDSIEELAKAFPTDRLAVFVPEDKTFDHLGLIRKSASLSALYSDVLYSHFLTNNVLVNYKRLPGCFAANTWKGAFKEIPAVICGAGPSLEKVYPTLRQLNDRALVFAGGSAITSLTRNQIQPHLAMALDPNDDEFDRLRQSHYFEGTYLFAPRLHKDVFATANGPFGFLKTDTGGLVENWLEERCGFDDPPIGPDLGPEAFSVTTLALSTAYAFGCNPIILTGVDLAYSGGKRYAAGVQAPQNAAEDPRALEKCLVRKDIYGNDVETLLKWVMEADAISAFAKAHPETTILNASEGGLGFEGINNVLLADALEGKQQRDFSGEIHQKIQFAPLKIDSKHLDSLYETLRASLANCKKLCRQILEETSEGKKALYRHDLEEEEAFFCFLSGIDPALDQVLPRYFPSCDCEKQQAACEVAKYQEMLRQMDLFGKGWTV